MTDPRIEQKAREVADKLVRKWGLKWLGTLNFGIPQPAGDDLEKRIAAALQSAVTEEREECESFVTKLIRANTQQEDESFPDAAGGPRQYIKKGEWLGSPWELATLKRWLAAIRARGQKAEETRRRIYTKRIRTGPLSP